MLRALPLILELLRGNGVRAEKDSNFYPWGDNPNIKYKMYWKDSMNVIEDLEKFSSLYIRVHGCVWSEYGIGTTYDDDGENHDGDENWYRTRVQAFRANAAFTLYGILRNDFHYGNKCSKKTYINSFFTSVGANKIAQLFDINVSPFADSAFESNYCYSFDNEASAYLNEKSSKKVSTTIGCTEDGLFGIAEFLGEDCDGDMFLKITDNLTLYNNAMNEISCGQVWSYEIINDADKNNKRVLGQSFNDDVIPTKFGSIAEKLLRTSFACDLDLFPVACPDPYGLKLKYSNAMKAAAKYGYPSIHFNFNMFQRIEFPSPTIFLSWVFLILTVVITVYSYWLKNQRYVASDGGGLKGLAAVAYFDLNEAFTTISRKSHVKEQISKKSKRTFAKKRKLKMTSKSGEFLRSNKQSITESEESEITTVENYSF
jgi:hypothetical protein